MTSYTRRNIAAAVLAVSFAVARSTYAQNENNIADQVTILPVSPDIYFARHVIGADGNSAGAAGERLIYSNTLGTFGAALGINKLVADDITTTVPGGCALRRYEFPVIGKVNPAGVGGTYTVDFAIYSSCPQSVPLASRPGLIIPGTQGQRTFIDECQNNTDNDGDAVVNDGCPAVGPAESEAQCLNAVDDDGDTKVNDGCPAVGDPETDVDSTQRLISFVPTIDAPLPTNFWFGVKFSRNNAGPIIGAPPTTGFSCDHFEFPGFPCGGADAGGFPEGPHASFNLEIFADSACAESYTGYKNDQPAGNLYNPGADVFLADDIELIASGCNMIAYEVAVRGLGDYTFRMQNNCDSGLIAGTERTWSQPNNTGAKIVRYSIDPPIPLPQNISFQASVNNDYDTSGVVIAGQQACIGETGDLVYIVGNNACTQVEPYEFGYLHGAFSLAITCAGTPPVGACCDMVFTDVNGDAVCHEVPQMNCPWPPRFTELEPKWVEGATCDSDPFPVACGLSACCRPDDVCENLTLNQCNAVTPLEAPRLWQRGDYCGEGEQTCPINACVDGEGDCLTEHPGPGCGHEECCTNVCTEDPFCCAVSWDRICVEATVTKCREWYEHGTCDTALTVEADSVTAFSNPGYASGTVFQDVCCGSNGPTSLDYGQRWFKFIATDTSAMLSLCGSDPAIDSLFNVYAVLDGPDPRECRRLTTIACGDDAVECGGALHGRICVRGLAPGQTYYVVVGPKYFSDRGFLQLELQSPCFEAPFWNPSDCNQNSIPDGCENGGGTTADCNGNDILDECESFNGTSFDCDDNGRLDECVGVWRELSPPMPMNQGSFGYSVGLDDPLMVVGSGYGGFRPSEGFPLEEYWRGIGGWQHLWTWYVPVAPTFVAVDAGWIVAASDRDAQAYVFPSGCTKCPPTVLQGPAIEPCQRFGVPIAIQGDLIALGKGFCQNAQSSTPEQVVLFRRVDYDWLEEARIEPPQSHGEGVFGASVAISGDRLVVGAPVISGAGTSMAHVYRREASAWVHEAVLHPAGLQEPAVFGRSAAIDGDVAVIGATFANTAWVFRRRGPNWEEEAKLQNPQSGGFERFGWSVAIARNTILVGDTAFTGSEAHYGGVTLFRRIGQQWILAENLDPGTANLRDAFGHSLDTDGSVAVVGMPAAGTREFEGSGSAFIFQLAPEDCNSNTTPDLCDVRGLPSADCNFNRIPDECEQLPPADSDFDDDVDLIDWASLQSCFTGPGLTTVPPCCSMFDFPPDSDVDLRDFAEFQIAFRGSKP